MNNLAELIQKFELWQWVIALCLGLVELVATFLLYLKMRVNLSNSKGQELQSSANSLLQSEQSLMTTLNNLNSLLKMAPILTKSDNTSMENLISSQPQNLKEKEKVKLQSELDRIINNV